MRHLNCVYTQRLSRENNNEGPLFRGRYKAVRVDKDDYLLEVLRDIHNNPPNPNRSELSKMLG